MGVPTRKDHRGAAPWVPERGGLDALRDAVQECRGCDLYAHATRAVFGDGPAQAEMMLVGEQPGDREDQDGHPFVGPAGRLLDRALEEAGLDREQVYVTNAVKHFRWSGHRGKQRLHKSPARWQVAACGPWLLGELDAVQPSVVVLLGSSAAQAVMGSAFRVTAHRGEPLAWPDDGPRPEHRPDALFATVHPSAVLRSRNREADFADLVDDLRMAAGAR
jgi:DNA polymerase